MTAARRLDRLFCHRALLAGGWASGVLLRFDAQGLIAAIETGLDKPPAGMERAAGPVIPGMPNLHSHAFQRAMAGLTERAGPAEDSFWTWREVMYGFVRRIDPDEFQAVAAMAYAEMLERGYTSVAEFHYLHHAPDGRAYADPAEMSMRILAAADATGIGLTHLPVLYAQGGFGGQPAGEGQRRFLNSPDRLLDIAAACRAAPGDHRIGLALHSLRAVSPEAAEAVLDGLSALDPTAPIHIHVAEQTAEVDASLAWSGRRPVEWLLDRGWPGPSWCLVHATHVTPAEVAGIAASGAVVGLCPTTEADLGDGLFPARDFLAQGGRFGIGSDSQIIIDVAEELRLLEFGQRLTARRRNLLASHPGSSTGADLYRTAVAGGAQALDRPEPAGGLKVGQRADLVVLDPDDPRLYGRSDDTLLDSYVFAGALNPVRDVVAGGRLVVRDGRHVDTDAIRNGWRRAVDRLHAA
ncbi:N-formimino-L-glutamate deiminase [Azospirillum sp. TSH7]|uniref:formimidoylglutamate deiminase n=1 Tax=unclassified Azospirillum TaxID=2630922 RepID=UPI000D60DFE1|nr:MULTISPECIES: formimidoylglutamate deiminase [unclassified Azospirillum]PWC55473.1 N-formimino-L-glutamate deiminase [Azospirillum sp. TSH7]PWC62145.1 N-formimino-L-glutamate deiminase [Azospirillum sp. TSH20]